METGKIRVGIVGATGYTGVELVRLFSAHPKAEIAYLTSESQDGSELSRVYPSLGRSTGLTLQTFDLAAAVLQCDVVFLARGNGWAMKHAAALLEGGCKVIDLAADFRLEDPRIWEEYYGSPHTSLTLVAEAVYGLPEIHREHIKQTSLIANPGCYPTSAILALAPALSEQWVEPEGIVISSASGVSGAGRSRTETAYLFGEIDQNFRAYNVGKHRHAPEISQELSDLSRCDVEVTFVPHLLPMTRGIHTTTFTTLADDVDEDDIRQSYHDYYKDEPFIEVLPAGELPETKQVYGSNKCRIGLTVIPQLRRLVTTSVIDNLVKGASGQAIQNMNIMFGIEETTGLLMPAVYP